MAFLCTPLNGGIIPTIETGRVQYGQGRIVLHRVMGNLQFLTVRDSFGDIQVAISKKRVPEVEWKISKLLDLGDIIVFTGVCAPTQKGEPTVWVDTFDVVSKSLSPPPAKYEGLTDIELRYRQRYVDLWSNPEVMKTFKTRSEIISRIRGCLQYNKYMEVETPILQTLAGGAAAKPFTTHHNSLDIPMYMRIAPELFLKRLLVGGMERVYEIGRNFRNEGLSPRHNPEFTALEVYDAYNDYEGMMNLAETIIADLLELVDSLAGVNGRTWMPFRRAKMSELCKELIAKPDFNYNTFSLRDTLELKGYLTPEEWYSFYANQVEPTLIHPTFVTHFPSSKVPLAKSDGQGYALAWELVVNGQELGCGYSEETDPSVQLERLRQQMGDGDESQRIDADFIEALSVGMPPAGGLGIGIDRLVMLLTGASSIRDVILFPTMKPQEG